MSLSQWLRQVAQRLPHGGKQGYRRRDGAAIRHRGLPQLEVLEDRLTPSGDVLAFTTAAQSFSTYAPSQSITVQLQDSSGKPVTAASNVTVNLNSTSSSGQFLDTSGKALSHPTLTIPKGANSVSFEYKDTQEGLPTLQAKAPAFNAVASQQEAVGVWLNIGTSSTVAYAQPGQPSQTIFVELTGQSGLFVTQSPVTIQLTSSSGTGRFLDASGKALSNGRLTIAAGSSSAGFEYEDSKASISNLSASLDGSRITTQMDVGTSLVFATPAQTLKAGQPSGTITLQLQDSHGKAVNTPSALTFILNSNSLSAKLLDSSGNPLPPPTFLSISAGSSSYSFKYEDSVGGKPTLTANVTLFNLGLSAKQQETVVGPYRVVLGMPGQSIAQNELSQPLTIQLQDSTGMAATATSAVTVQLSSSSPTGQFFDASGKALSENRLTIPAGSSSAGFEYKDSKAGFPTLTISENGLTSQQQVNVGVSLAFTTPAQTLKAGQLSKTITMQLQDSHGKAVITPGILPLYLSFNSGSGQFLDSTGKPLPYPSVSIPAGASSFSFKYVDSVGGKPTLEATAELMTGSNLSATQQETVVGPYKVVFGTYPTSIAQNEPSQPIAVQLIDSTGMAAKVTSPLTIQLSSSSHTGQFLDALGKPLSNGRLIIPAGSSSASFEYKDSQAGFPTLTVSENGFTTQQQVNVGVSFAFTTPAQNLKAGQTSGVITVQLRDGNGKPFIAPSTLIASLNSNSLTGQFLDTSEKPFSYPYFTIPAGSSSLSFTYKDGMGGKPTLTAAVSLMSGTNLIAMQHETVAGPYRVIFSPLQQTVAIPQNKPSQPLTVQLQDSTGDVAAAASAVTVQLSSSSPTGQFLDAFGKPLSNGRLTIPAGSSSAGFEYKDSQAGIPTLTAAANGFSSPTAVVVGASLVFTTPAQALKAGQVSQPITVQLQDSHGKAIATPFDLPITLSSSLNTVEFLNAGSGPMTSTVIIPGGSSSSSFTISSNWGGKPILTASVAGMPLSATQQESIQGLGGVVFTTPPQTLAAGQKSQRVTLQLEDSNGKAAVAPSGGLTIYLSGNPTPFLGNSTVQFFDANGKPITPSGTFPYINTALTIPAGSNSVSFQYETTQAGSISLVAQPEGAGPISKQVETIHAGPSRSLVFLTPAQTPAAGTPSGSITVQLEDQYGNPVAAGRGGIPFNLHSSSSSGAFLSAAGDPLAGSSITLPQGLSSATFEYKDSRAGTPTLTVSANGLSGSQKQSITPASAEIHVTNTKDSGTGSLRAAITAANANPGSTIVFDSWVKGAIDLLSALPAITANTNILGPGANLLTVERSGTARTDFGIFVVGTNGNTAQPAVVLSGLTVANGTGSGITNMGYLTLQRMVVRNNQAPATSWPSGGVFPYGSPGGIGNFGALTVLNSTIANNSTTTAPLAAGIDSENGSVLILNSTITGNRGAHTNRTGGIGIYGSTALIENSTISGNTAGQFSSSGGGIDSNGQVTLYDTLVAGNLGSANNPTDVSGAFISLGHNLIGEAGQQSSGFLRSDLVGTTARPIDPKLGTLGTNGGPTPTLALLTGSPAIGAGSSVNAPATDQRGDPRPQGTIDVGAFERT